MALTDFCLTRDFTDRAAGGFSASITVCADPACAILAITGDFSGESLCHGDNLAAPNARSQHYLVNWPLQLAAHIAPIGAQPDALSLGAGGAADFAMVETQGILGRPCLLPSCVVDSD